jgi:hypothetical protein
MMKNISLSFVFISLLLSNGIGAMEQQQAYPWYQSYKNPEFQKTVSEGWQKTRQRVGYGLQRTQAFVKTHKTELAAIAALVGIYLTDRAYNKIFQAYGKSRISLTEIRKENKKEYAELVKIGIKAYANRLRDKGMKNAFIKNLPTKHTSIYEKYTPDLERALWRIMETK